MLKKLEDVLETLETENVTGVFQGTLPDIALTLAGQEKAVAVRNDIESINRMSKGDLFQILLRIQG